MIGVKTNILEKRVTIKGRDNCIKFINSKDEKVKNRLKSRLSEIGENTRKLSKIKTFTQVAKFNGKNVKKTTYLISVNGKAICLHFSQTEKDNDTINEKEKETIEQVTE